MSDRTDQYPTALFEGRYSEGWYAVARFDAEDVMGADCRLTLAWESLHGDDVDYMCFRDQIKSGEFPIHRSVLPGTLRGDAGLARRLK